MAVENDVPRPRRALLAGGLGGLMAIVAAAVGRPDVARAGTDGDVVLGGVNFWAGPTTIQSTSGNAIEGYAPASGVGVFGEGVGGGMHGFSVASIGVEGQSNTGTGVVGTSPSIGVSGTSTTGTGVSGSSSAPPLAPPSAPLVPLADDPATIPAYPRRSVAERNETPELRPSACRSWRDRPSAEHRPGPEGEPHRGARLQSTGQRGGRTVARRAGDRQA